MDGERPAIWDIRDNSTFRYVSHEFFKGDFPAALIEEHSHWLSERGFKLKFRAKHFTEAQFGVPKFSEEEGKYVMKTEVKLSKKRRHVYEEQDGGYRRLLDVRSKSFRRVYNATSFFECDGGCDKIKSG